MAVTKVVVEQNSSLLGPILVGLAAVIAAILTALFAHWRLKKQLKDDGAQQMQRLELRLQHDRQLREQQLEHDRQLHENQLNHDRSVRHREGMRLFLDEAVKREREFKLQAQLFFSALQEAEDANSDRKQLSADDQQRLSSWLVSIANERGDVLNDEVILGTYLGNHKLVTVHERVHDTIRDLLARLGDLPLEVRTAEHRAADEESLKVLSVAQSAFLAEVRSWHEPVNSTSKQGRN